MFPGWRLVLYCRFCDYEQYPQSKRVSSVIAQRRAMLEDCAKSCQEPVAPVLMVSTVLGILANTFLPAVASWWMGGPDICMNCEGGEPDFALPC